MIYTTVSPTSWAVQSSSQDHEDARSDIVLQLNVDVSIGEIVVRSQAYKAKQRLWRLEVWLDHVSNLKYEIPNPAKSDVQSRSSEVVIGRKSPAFSDRCEARRSDSRAESLSTNYIPSSVSVPLILGSESESSWWNPSRPSCSCANNGALSPLPLL